MQVVKHGCIGNAWMNGLPSANLLLLLALVNKSFTLLQPPLGDPLYYIHIQETNMENTQSSITKQFHSNNIQVLVV